MIKNIMHSLILLTVFAGLQPALAIVPPTLNYQGHLTDSAGVPIDGPVNMSFAIYDVDSGGTALWSDTRSVTVDQGVFSVELGGGGNPFPVGLFEDPLWMGLSVGTDAEMTPRRPLSSTAYSFKADDANTLEGVSASTLDQSAHVLDTANPHAVSPAQIGAADAAALSAHTGNTSNPHSVTAAQTGAASSADFTTHTGNASAHHTRYSNAEAVSAMGTKSDSNPLHHDKYTDSNAVAAVLASDGAGSTLDADLVDGLQASELIDAAQDEVRTPISALPYTISQPGSYYLTGNLDGTSGGIDITSDDVTLDLMGFTIDGGGSIVDAGIDFVGRSNITVRNGTIKGFGYAGIQQLGTGSHATITDMSLHSNSSVSTAYGGIVIYSTNSHIERCKAFNNSGYGIHASGTGSTLINNNAYNNGGNYGIYAGTSAILKNNTAYNNTNSGIRGGANSILINNTSYSNAGTYAIAGSTNSLISGNTAYTNSSTYAIHAAASSTVTNNNSYSNTNWGIYALSGCLIERNTMSYNNTAANTARGGLYFTNDNRVVGNTLDNNSQNNIYANSGDSIIAENHVTDSLNGITFTTSGNYYKNNTGAGNTTFVNLNGTTQTDGGGNVSF